MEKRSPLPPIPPAPPPPKRLPALRVRSLPRASGFLAGLRIRKKLLVIHTVFSLSLGAILVVFLRPALKEVVRQAELDESKLVLRTLASSLRDAPFDGAESVFRVGDVSVVRGTAASLGLTPEQSARAALAPGIPIPAGFDAESARAAIYVPLAQAGDENYYIAEARIESARSAVTQLYVLTVIALLAAYTLVVVALETLVLPQHVYGPIRRMLDADQAVQEGRTDDELIPAAAIPADELGEIMRSRNESIVSLRKNQKALAETLDQLEQVANDLKRKNHLLEAARRNIADADRLASLGMMSAGIAHELNTPLTVLKGLVETLDKDPTSGVDPATSALMVRVVRRLEKLGESLLDFARIRPPHTRAAHVAPIIDEAITLVKLDRDASEVTFANHVPASAQIECDADRFVQVFVNLLRNAVDAVRRRSSEGSPTPHEPARIDVSLDSSTRDGREWFSLAVADNGPGIDPDVLQVLFEPFVSTRLDSRGTGLGLAVADGIVREHGGVILARNRPGRSGSIFEIMLPTTQSGRTCTTDLASDTERIQSGGNA